MASEEFAYTMRISHISIWLDILSGTAMSACGSAVLAELSQFNLPSCTH